MSEEKSTTEDTTLDEADNQETEAATAKDAAAKDVAAKDAAAEAGLTRPSLRLPTGRLGRLNTALAALVAVLAVLTAAVLIGGARVLPWDTSAEKQAADYTDAKEAAEKGVMAFLDVDYRDMDPRIQAVKEVSTGTFGKQYGSTAEEIRQAAISSQAVSKGDVKQVGLRSIGPKKAVALVAADVTVTNAQTTQLKKTDTCPKDGTRCDKYRFAVTLTKTAKGWRMSDLAGVS